MSVNETVVNAVLKDIQSINSITFDSLSFPVNIRYTRNDSDTHMLSFRVEEAFLVCLHLNDVKHLNFILDWLNVPSDNLNTKQRMCYYQLLIED